MADNNILQTAKSNLDKLGDALAQKVGTAVGNEDGTSIKTSLSSSTALSTLESTMTKSIPNGMIIAPEVYEKIAKSVYEKFQSGAGAASKKYSTDDTTLIKQILGEISSGFASIPDTKVDAKVKGSNVTYTIKFDMSAGLKGQSVTAATVSDGTNKATLVMTTNSKKLWLNTAQRCISSVEMQMKKS